MTGRAGAAPETPVIWVNDRQRYHGDATHRWIRETYAESLSNRKLIVIGKNPSTAARENKGDPTFTSVQFWAARKGFGRVCLVNLFALRSPHPRDLERRSGQVVDLADAVGAGNDDVLRHETAGDAVVVAAWGGADKFTRSGKERYHRRISDVLEVLDGVHFHTVGAHAPGGYPLHGYCWNGLRQDTQLRPTDSADLRPF